MRARGSSGSSAGRWLRLASWSVLCGILSYNAALIGLHWSLPPTDEAYGMSTWDVLTDPFVLTVAPYFTVLFTALGLVAARVFLWNSRLAVTAPLVTAVSVLACLVCGRFSLLAALPALFAAVLAMVWCGERFPAHSARRGPRGLRA